MQLNGIQVLAYLPFEKVDLNILYSKGMEINRFYVLANEVDYDSNYEMEIFSRYGADSFMVPTDKMIPVCRDEEYGSLFTVKFFSDSSPVIASAPSSTNVVLTELQPLIEGGCLPILFTKMEYPFDYKMEPLPMRIALERTVGFFKEEDAILAQVIAEGRDR